MKNLFILTVLFCALTFPFMANAQSTSNSQNGRPWTKKLRQEAVASGIKPELFDRIFNDLQPNKKLIRLDRNQPETRLTFYKYRSTRGDPYRIKVGRQEYRRYEELLEEIGQRYGVSPCIIVALWGLESSYGRFMGNFDVIKSLAVLAQDDRRGDFFRKELLLALQMVNEGHVSLQDFKGEWAGGSGHPQFLPSSWYKHAVDYNLDGRKDIWKTHSDVFASIANYLRKKGWKKGQPVLVEVKLPENFDKNLMGRKQKKTVQAWKNLGVQIKPHQSSVEDNLLASIMKPYGGPNLMIFNNFRVLLRWNYSSFYVGTVSYVSQQICRNKMAIKLASFLYNWPAYC